MSASAADMDILFTFSDKEDGVSYPGYINIFSTPSGDLVITVRGVSNPDRAPEEMQWKVLPRAEAVEMIKRLNKFAEFSGGNL